MKQQLIKPEVRIVRIRLADIISTSVQPVLDGQTEQYVTSTHSISQDMWD